MYDSLDEIRTEMREIRGAHVMLRARNGRRGGYERDGILEGLYPEGFTVLVKEHGYRRRDCFSYSGVLTRHVEIGLYPEPGLSASPET
jgi:uncharacterized protein Veg